MVNDGESSSLSLSLSLIDTWRIPAGAKPLYLLLPHHHLASSTLFFLLSKMPPPCLFQLESNGRNWKGKEETEMGDGGHTILEREVADIIIYLLHRQDSVSDRRFDCRSSETSCLDLGFPRWNGKRKRSAHGSVSVPRSNAGEAISKFQGGAISGFSSDAQISFHPCKENEENPASQLKARVESRESCSNLIQGDLKTGISDYEQRGLRFWPDWNGIRGGREFVVPDLNMSAEDLAAAAVTTVEMRRRQEEVYQTACRRLAAAEARRKRKELQRLKNSIAADCRGEIFPKSSLWP